MDHQRSFVLFFGVGRVACVGEIPRSIFYADDLLGAPRTIHSALNCAVFRQREESFGTAKLLICKDVVTEGGGVAVGQ